MFEWDFPNGRSLFVSLNEQKFRSLRAQPSPLSETRPLGRGNMDQESQGRGGGGDDLSPIWCLKEDSNHIRGRSFCSTEADEVCCLYWSWNWSSVQTELKSTSVWLVGVPATGTIKTPQNLRIRTKTGDQSDFYDRFLLIVWINKQRPGRPRPVSLWACQIENMPCDKTCKIVLCQIS